MAVKQKKRRWPDEERKRNLTGRKLTSYPHIPRMRAAKSIGAGAGETEVPSCVAGDQYSGSKLFRISLGIKRVRLA